MNTHTQPAIRQRLKWPFPLPLRRIRSLGTSLSDRESGVYYKTQDMYRNAIIFSICEFDFCDF